MKVSEYRDLIDELSDVLASAKSAATVDELTRETERLGRKRDELLGAVCKVAKERDRNRAGRVLEFARQFISDAMMAIYDNQRIEAEYLGEEYPFINPSAFERLG